MAWCNHLVHVSIGQYMFPCVTWLQALKLKALRVEQENTVRALFTDTHVSGEFSLQPSSQNPVSTPIQTLYFYIPERGQFPLGVRGHF